MMASQALFTALSARGGKAAKAGVRADLAGRGGTVGVLAETITYRTLSPARSIPSRHRSF